MKGTRIVVSVVALGVISACERTRDMPERVDMADSAQVRRAMENRKAADSMLDTMPGGKMARGDSAATVKLLKKKM